MDIKENIEKDGTVKIIVNTKADKTQIDGYDKDRKAFRLRVKEPPIKDKANKEIIKFFKKSFKKDVKIISGLKSKEKKIKIIDKERK